MPSGVPVAGDDETLAIDERNEPGKDGVVVLWALHGASQLLARTFSLAHPWRSSSPPGGRNLLEHFDEAIDRTGIKWQKGDLGKTPRFPVDILLGQRALMNELKRGRPAAAHARSSHDRRLAGHSRRRSPPHR